MSTNESVEDAAAGGALALALCRDGSAVRVVVCAFLVGDGITTSDCIQARKMDDSDTMMQ